MSTTYIFPPSVMPHAPNLVAGPSVPPIEHEHECHNSPCDNLESSGPEDSLPDANAPAMDLGDPVEDHAADLEDLAEDPATS